MLTLPHPCNFFEVAFVADKASPIRVDGGCKLSVNPADSSKNDDNDNIDCSITAQGTIDITRAGSHAFLVRKQRRNTGEASAGFLIRSGDVELEAKFNFATGDAFVCGNKFPDYIPKNIMSKAEHFLMVFIVREDKCAVRFCGDDFDGPEIPLTDLPVGATVAHIVACLSDEDAELEFVSPKSTDFGKQLNVNKLNVVAKAFSERAQLKEKYQVQTRRSNLLDAAFNPHFPAPVSSRLDGHCANALITGPAKSGKSSLFNALFCLCNGSELDVVPRSTNETD